MTKQTATVDDDSGTRIFPDKYLKKLPTGFVDTAESMSNDELKKVIIDAEGNLVIIEREKEAHVELQDLKEKLKALNGGFREAIGAQSAKIKYALFLLEGRGVDLDSTDSND